MIQPTELMLKTDISKEFLHISDANLQIIKQMHELAYMPLQKINNSLPKIAKEQLMIKKTSQLKKMPTLFDKKVLLNPTGLSEKSQKPELLYPSNLYGKSIWKKLSSKNRENNLFFSHSNYSYLLNKLF